MNSISPSLVTSLALALAIAASCSVAGAQPMAPVAPAASPTSYVYFGDFVGASAFHVKAADGLIATGKSGSQHVGAGMFIGYQFNDTFGVEAGSVWAGKASRQFSVGRYRAIAESAYLAGTAKLFSHDDFSVSLKLGVATNQLRAMAATAAVPAFSKITGSNTTSLLVGFRGEYAVTKRASIVFDLTAPQRFSNKVSATQAGLGLKYQF